MRTRRHAETIDVSGRGQAICIGDAHRPSQFHSPPCNKCVTGRGVRPPLSIGFPPPQHVPPNGRPGVRDVVYHVRVVAWLAARETCGKRRSRTDGAAVQGAAGLPEARGDVGR